VKNKISNHKIDHWLKPNSDIMRAANITAAARCLGSGASAEVMAFALSWWSASAGGQAHVCWRKKKERHRGN